MQRKSPPLIWRSAPLVPTVGLALALLASGFPPANAKAAEAEGAGAASEKGRALRILQICGMHFQYYRVSEAAQLLQAAPVAVAYLHSKHYQKDEARALPGFPTTLPDLSRFDVVVMNDTPVVPRPTAQLTEARLKLLCDYVEAGGSLLIFGGHNGFAGGGYGESALAAMLPVKVKPRFDVAWLKPPVEIAPAEGFFQDVNWRKRPVVVWLHRFDAVQEDATILARAVDEPAIIGRKWGKGRVAVVAATCLGLPPEGRVGFWDWPDWPKVAAETIQWLTKKEG